jgi:hypothetical protein
VNSAEPSRLPPAAPQGTGAGGAVSDFARQTPRCADAEGILAPSEPREGSALLAAHSLLLLACEEAA